MNCLVTGATGFIGSRLVRLLLERDHRVRCFVRPGPKVDRLRRFGVDVVLGDIRNPDAAVRAVADIDWVFHNAAVIYHHSPRTLYRVNLGGTLNLLAACIRSTTLRHLVASSSVTAIGPCTRLPADESQPMTPARYDVYGRSKRAIELACRRWSAEQGVPVSVVRMAGVYGPGSPLFGRALRLIGSGFFILPGTQDHLCHFAHVDDVCQALLLAARRPSAGFRTYTAVDEHPVTIHQLLIRVAGLLGVRLRLLRVPIQTIDPGVRVIEWLARAIRVSIPVSRTIVDYFVRDHVYSADRVRSELGWTPRFPDPLEGIATLVDWYLAEHRSLTRREPGPRL